MDKQRIKLIALTLLSLFVIIFGIIITAINETTTPVGYFIKITSDSILDVTSRLIKDITSRFLDITTKLTAQASFTYSAAAAPYLSQNIPNQTWNEDTNISLNLSLYFSDPNNDDLSYSVFNSVDNITITINNNTNLAYLYPDKNFYGIRYVIFNVTDGIYTNSSNNITLNVTSVNDAPIFNGTNILNRTWDEDNNLTHIFNISGYFSDVEGDSLTYSTIGNSSIKIEIINGNVSLIPDKDWYGTEYVVFTASDGINTINSNNITLTVNSMPEIQTITEAGFSGLTTDLSNMNSTQLQNITNFTLEKTEYGFLRFRENVNLSIDINFSNPNHINISNNFAFINITLFPQLNKSAEIKFYNLTFTNPQILKDGEVCPAHICTELDYSSGTLFFNVSHFTTYTTRETPVVEREMPPAAAAAVSPGGGGGGAAGAATFSLSKDTIKLVVSPGIKKTTRFNVKNLGTIVRDYTIEVEGVEEFVTIKEKSFSLEPAQSKDIEVVIEVPEDIELDVYTGRIIVRSALISKMINVINEIQSLEPIFDVDVDVFKTHKKIISDREVLAQISIYDLRELGKVDVNVYYIIKDMKGNEIIKDKEVISVDTITEFIKSITLPKIEPGSYVFVVKAVYQGSVGTATDMFEVVTKEEIEVAYPAPVKIFAPLNMVLWLSALLIITLIILVILDIIRKGDLIKSVKEKKKLLKTWIKKIKREKEGKKKEIKRKERGRQREEEKKKEKALEKKEEDLQKYKIIKDKIEKSLGLLKKAYESKYISEEAYQKDSYKLKKKFEEINKKILLFFLLLIIPFVSGELVSLNVGLLDISKQDHPGDEVFAEISLVNIALNKEDVTIEYYIIDGNENIINTESETVLMTTRINRIRSLELPENIRSGRYYFVVKVIYKDEIIGKAIDSFEVIEVEKPYNIEKDVMPYILIILIFFFILFMIYEYIRFKQIERLIKKINERNLRKCLKLKK